MENQLISNPFDQINLRFNKIENLLLQLHAAKDLHKHPNVDDQDIIQIDEAANLTKYSKPAIYAYVKRGQIPCIRTTGRKILFSKKALQDWLQQGRKLTLSEIQRQSERLPLPTL